MTGRRPLPPEKLAATTTFSSSSLRPINSSMAQKSHTSNYNHQQQFTRKKKKKLTLESQTLTLAPNPTHSNPKKRHRIISASTYGNRKWTFSTRDFSNHTDRVVFVSYNILGVDNASRHPDLYYNVLPKYVDWNLRKKLIRKEILGYNPGILCFQEVDRFDELAKLLQRDGFIGVYQARTGAAYDGCAIFWKNELFRLLHQESIKFNRFGLRDNVAQFCVLKMIRNQSDGDADAEASKMLTSRRLLVGNTHVLFNPSRGDIKLGQVRLFLQKTRQLSEAWGNIPTILGGDFNSTPQSAIYQFLVSSELNIQQHDRRNISGQICPPGYAGFGSPNNYAGRFHMSVSWPLPHGWSDEELWLATGTDGLTDLQHDLKLRSVYFGIPGSSLTRDMHGEPLATSFHSKFVGTVDYIWHTEELVPVRVLETLPIDILRKTGGLPSKEWGSDHLALVCELAFADE